MTEQIINMELEAAAALRSLMDEAAQVSYPTKTRSAAQRREDLIQALATMDLERLIELQEKMSKAVDQIVANKIDPEADEICTPDELQAFMREHLDQADIADLLEMRYAARRARIFAHITAMHADAGVEDPEHTPGEVVVPELRKKFVRQGGRLKVTLDEAKLMTLLGPKRAKRVFKKHKIPARVEVRRDDEALMELVTKDPAVMEMVRDCVVPNGHTAASFHVRNL